MKSTGNGSFKLVAIGIVSLLIVAFVAPFSSQASGCLFPVLKYAMDRVNNNANLKQMK